MPMSGDDRWARIHDPEAVAAAVERLEQFARMPSERAAWSRIIELLAPGRGDKALDVGAGRGDISIRIARRVAPDGLVAAVDLSPGLLGYARIRAREAGVDGCFTTVAADAHVLPWDDNCFDRALCHWVLLHVDDPAAVVSQLRRVVRPGGCVVCVEVDWATMTVYPGDASVTQAIVAANVARQRDGRMGRKLVSLLRDSGCRELTVVPIVDVETAPEADSWLAFLATRIAVAEAAGVSPEALAQWWRDVDRAAQQGRYFFSLTQFAVAASVP